MTEITLTQAIWEGIHPDFKTTWGDDQLAEVWDEDTGTLELVRVELSDSDRADLAALDGESDG
jgi:hypothetical protein